MTTDTDETIKMAEDHQWEVEEGIPQMTDPFIQKYFQGRDALIVQENKHRSDKDFREMLSPMAMEACSIVNAIRFEELQTLWQTSELEDSLAKQYNADIHPGMAFMLARDRIEKSKLFNIIRKMPKGALLHCHFDAMVDMEYLINLALDEVEGIHFYAPQPLDTAEARAKTFFKFCYKKTKASAGSASIWSKDYLPNTYIPIQEAAATFPDGGKDGFIQYFVSRSSIGLEESLNGHIGPNAIWRRFADCFMVISSLVSHEPIFRRYCQRLFMDLMADGIRYVEIRSAFAFEWRPEGKEEPLESFDGHREFVRCLKEEIEKFQATEEGKGFWGARIIWVAIRIWDNRRIVESMKDCIEIKLEFPEMISGFDVAAQEDLGRSLADLTPLLFWFRKQCAAEGVNIPFFFHAGETQGTGTETDHNLFDAITLGTRRLGHAFSLYKHPLLMNMARDKRVLVECCPISNQILRFCNSMQSHPLPALLANGVPVSLCNDDPALLGRYKFGLSHDFFQVMQALESLGMEGLGALAEDSVRWSAFEDLNPKDWMDDVRGGTYSKVGKGLRAKRMREWKREWEKFCQWVCIEYGTEDYGFGGEGEEGEFDLESIERELLAEMSGDKGKGKAVNTSNES